MEKIKRIPDLSVDEKESARKILWEKAKETALSCKGCSLSATRANVVFGDGNEHSKLLFIGEGPGADEDAQGLPFVGRAGKLLTQILTAGGIDRKDVYLTNIVKCRPSDNRVPTPEEMIMCDQHLQTQIMLIDPALIVLLGNTPTKWILKSSEGITKIRGKWFEWRGTAVMPMFHPSYLLRNASSKEGSPKHLTWIDIQEVKSTWDIVKETGNIDHIKFG
ncbi:MAG: uracil-DNA glycosylase [Synergistaceae bacterium]|jgi:DNA polymerase|nr:uracil-DNA glycosylase [Synergistaceae bacterium]